VPGSYLALDEDAYATLSVTNNFDTLDLGLGKVDVIAELVRKIRRRKTCR
jgi:hypothetical protein